MSAADTIREARNILFERGWRQGSLGQYGTTRCLLGALCEAGSTEGIVEAYHAVEAATGTAGVPLWNDVPGRTFNEVIDVLDKAEKIAERWPGGDTA